MPVGGCGRSLLEDVDAFLAEIHVKSRCTFGALTTTGLVGARMGGRNLAQTGRWSNQEATGIEEASTPETRSQRTPICRPLVSDGDPLGIDQGTDAL